MTTPLRKFFAAATLLVMLCLLPACRTSGTRADASSDTPLTAVNQGYATLYATISDDADLDKVLMIKRPSPQVAELIKAISQFCHAARDRMDALRTADPALELDRQGLPQMEVQTRRAITDATSKQVFFSSGNTFEVRILLTQHEALNYITHLSATLARSEPDAERRQFLTQLSSDSEKLRRRVLTLLESNRAAPARDPE